jgi:hypothetical protein
VNDLLSLKQQQASVVQAYEAMKQGEETVRQGKAIMVFTVMTILFVRDLLLPLSPTRHTQSKLTNITAAVVFHELPLRHERRRAYGLRPVTRRRRRLAAGTRRDRVLLAYNLQEADSDNVYVGPISGPWRPSFRTIEREKRGGVGDVEEVIKKSTQLTHRRTQF